MWPECSSTSGCAFAKLILCACILKSYLLSEREFTIISKETVKASPCKKSWYFLRGIVLLRIGEPNCIISSGKENERKFTGNVMADAIRFLEQTGGDDTEEEVDR